MPSPRVRHAVRVLLLDDHDRLLLFRGQNPETGAVFWFPAGGEVEEGESAHETATREVAEETGLSSLSLGAEVWHRRHVFEWRGETIDQRERWFVARVASFDVSTESWTDIEREDITAHRWWTIQELHDTTDDLVPLSLAVRLDQLLRDGPPQVPTDVGV
jgi:8-oxo-dGTP pyrophosphatase MutT (NUDIX family)